MGSSQRYQLDNEGYFQRDGQPFFPVGVNYWPASCGVELWQAWPEEEIRHDLDVLAKLGLNTIRFFVRWQDFEPVEGKYDEKSFTRLRQMLQWCRERNLAAHPSMFVGWMSGGIFWPVWKQNRNLFSDAHMIERSVSLVEKLAGIFAEFQDAIVSIDQGNEMCCLPDCGTTEPAHVIKWCGLINQAVRRKWPTAIMISGNEQNQLAHDTGWRFGDQPGCDLYSMHGYPVPVWHPIRFDGMNDPLAQTLLPFYTQVARAFGPVMLQEFGVIPAFGTKAAFANDRPDKYLRAILPAAWEAGANGFLYWCMRDVMAPVHPYTKNPFEQSLGLIGDDDQIKPGLAYFGEFAKSLVSRARPNVNSGTVGMYFPCHYYNREEPGNPGNDPRRVAKWMAIANYLLRQLGYKVRVVRGDQPLPGDLKALLIPGMQLDLSEMGRLGDWVRAGGRAIWHGVGADLCCDTLTDLLGAAPIDYRAAINSEINVFGRSWTLPFAGPGYRAEFQVSTAEVLCTDQGDVGQAFVNQAGAGKIFWTPMPIEEAMCQLATLPVERDLWAQWYRGALQMVTGG